MRDILIPLGIFWLFMGVVTFWGLRIHLRRYMAYHWFTLHNLSWVPADVKTDEDHKRIIAHRMFTRPFYMLFNTVLAWPIPYHIILSEYKTQIK